MRNLPQLVVEQRNESVDRLASAAYEVICYVDLTRLGAHILALDSAPNDRNVGREGDLSFTLMVNESPATGSV
jgi:hypothetical protein